MLVVYNLIFLIFALLYLPYLFFRLVANPSYGRGFLMRLGILPKEISKKLSSEKTIWLHAVSVGEVMGAKTLLDNLRYQFPNHRLVISTITQTGNQIAKEMARAEEAVIYFPFDLSFIARRMIRKVSPSLFLIVETEIWPNFITVASREGVRTVLVNGRISPRSFRGYRKVRFLLKGVLGEIDLFLMQTDSDSEKIISLGAPQDKVKVAGNIKFDQVKLGEISRGEVSRLRAYLKLTKDEELLVAGSTHPGEEKVLIEVYQSLSQRYRKLRLLLAPRHPERSPQVEKLVKKYGLIPVRVSRLPYLQPSTLNPQNLIFILDTIGQLRSIYAVATVVFVGGSLVPRGGHNPIEPAILKKPILFGPWLFNFQAIADELVERKAAILIRDKEELNDVLSSLLDDPSQRELLGARAKATVELSIGATKRSVDLIKGLFDKR